MSVRREKKKNKKIKEEALQNPSLINEADVGEKMRQALKDTSKIMLFAGLFPLKFELSEEKSEFYLSSFLLSARFKNDKKGFSFELTRSAMNSSDFVNLFKTLYLHYKSLCR